jgi:hypothetical protein
MIGAKTVMSSLSFVAAIVLGLWVGLSPARLATLSASEAFWAGLFAFLGGSLIHRYWRLHLPSATYFRWSEDAAWADESHFVGTDERKIVIGENEGEAWDFSPRTQYALWIALAFWIGLLTLDSRAVDLLASIPKRIEAPGSEYCKEDKPVAAVEIARDPGCILIQRAFELGYAKSLGPCEAKLEEKKRGPCNLRRLDESFVDYARRKLEDAWSAIRRETSPKRIEEAKRSFATRTEHLSELYDASDFTISGDPRSSHHVFTNLPDPNPWIASSVRQQSCAERYRRLPHLPDTPSRAFEHVMAQLLFETRYARMAGDCREYTIHWDAPVDACDRLVREPEAFLSDQGALSDVEGVLHRYRVTQTLQNVSDVAGGMSSLASILGSVPPQRFVSFQCWIEEERAEVATSSRALSLEEWSFAASEVRVPIRSASSVERHHHIASMFVPTFHYGKLLSDASPGELLGTGVDAKFFAGRDGFLSRLAYLNDVDLLLGHAWIEERSDLLEVYPWHVHLENYVELFRVRYRAERGRL